MLSSWILSGRTHKTTSNIYSYILARNFQPEILGRLLDRTKYNMSKCNELGPIYVGQRTKKDDYALG
jgi:hypothetical protein